MKRCPTCQQTFSDDISFCLQDGTPLGSAFDQHEHATVVRGGPVAQYAPPGRSPFLTCSIIAVLCLVLVGVIGVIIFALTYSSQSVRNAAQSNKDQDAINQQNANLRDQQAEIDKQKQEIANARKTLDDAKNKLNANTGTPVTDPPTARINFHRGSVQETVSGSVIKRRSYVLRTGSGQFLSASLNSAGNCAVFTNNSTDLSYTTSAGDSSLTVVNNCPSPANFSLTVFIR